MGYSHNQKRKIIRRFKRIYGDDELNPRWYPHYQKHVDEIKRELQGPCLGTMEDLIRMMGGIERMRISAK